MSTLDVTPLSSDEIGKIARERGVIFVMNNSDMGRSQSRGDYFLGIVDRHGREQPIKIPNTWVPINLAEFMRWEEIIDSSSFRESIRKQLIVAITPEAAMEILQRPDARAEAAKVSRENAALGVVAPATKISISTGTANFVALPTDANKATVEQRLETESDRQLIALVNAFNNNGVSEVQATEQLRSLSPSPSRNALMDASEMIGMKSSTFYRTLAELIDEAGEPEQSKF